MRIAYLLRYFPMISQTFIYRELEGLRQHGLDTRVFVWERRRGPSPVWNVGEVEDLPRGLRYVPAVMSVLFLLLFRPFATWRATRVGLRLQRPKDVLKALWMAWRVRRLGVDRLMAPFGAEAAELVWVVSLASGIPWGCTLHAAELFRPRSSLAKLVASADCLYVVSEYTRQWVLSQFGRDAIVLRCGNELMPPSPHPPHLEILTVARAVEKKGLDTCVAAARILDERGIPYRWRVVGDGPLLADLRQKVAQGGNLQFVGALEWPQVAALYAGGISMFVLPAQVDKFGDRDALPVALVEAMAQGVPVISTPVGGIPELVQEGITGWLVPPAQPESLVEVMLRMSEDSEGVARVVDAARRLVAREYRPDNLARHLLGLSSTST